jgi:aerobic-type carbon monoxide dehydrogenase small subunit (CoxS/CutS family)
MGNTVNKKKQAVTRRTFLKGLGGGAAGAALVTRIKAQPAMGGPTGVELPPSFLSKTVTFSVNGKDVSVDVEPRQTLLEILRDKLELTGTKKICGRGECGGCTVLMDGRAVYACLFPAVRASGTKITTIEGLADGETLHPVQEAFIEKDGYQCGFCTSGFILSTLALLNRNTSPSPSDIKTALSGNICRCGNYVKISEAVAEAARKMRKA